MRVLMLSRDDVHEVIGGDTIQMARTKAGLEKHGLEIHSGTLSNMPAWDGFDLVHIFNWQQLEPILLNENRRLYPQPQIILSPIFWFHAGHWFDEAVEKKKLWKGVCLALGAARGRALYEKWQQTKFRSGAQGRNFRKYLSVPASLLPNSNAEIVHLEAVFGLDGRLQPRCTVVPNGVDRSLYDPLPKANQKFLEKYAIKDFVIQAARIQSAKNQLALIEALFDLPIPIVFAGQPSPYEPEYVNRCYELAKQRGNVHFIGPLSPEELAGVYVLAAVHALPSWRETPGLASLEAAAAGCRIVSTSMGCAREYFGNQAWYCDPGDQGSIRQAVQDAYLASPSTSLRDLVLERFTWDTAAQITLDVYHQVLGGKNTIKRR